MNKRLYLDILPQPDDVTCGPTCLQAVYRYFDKPISLESVIDEVVKLSEGGTLAVLLGNHALKQQFRATLYTYNLTVFDPTWFNNAGVDLQAKLKLQSQVKHNPKLQAATEGYLDFLELGGKIKFEILNGELLRRCLKQSIPILTGLSATYLYGSAREISRGPKMEYDDVHGEPVGHFVVLCGYHAKDKTVLVADPLHPNPVSHSQIYEVDIDRLIGAILLGVVTYDANLLIIEPN